ncbi:MAG: hypothetical protein OXB95_00750 [Rhodobacteraceae bacterium]|nr:hypothetical protein [Paracoccaceae bacterium]
MIDRLPSILALAALIALATPSPPAGGDVVHQDGTGISVAADPEGWLAGLTTPLLEFQRRANAQIALHMSAVESGGDPRAFLLGLAIAFTYGAIHAFGPGHGKFVIVSYFIGREARAMRGVYMAVQIAIVHVIAAVLVVWLADLILRSGFGISLSEVPGVRAASFLIIVGIGLYMLYGAIRTSRSPAAARQHSHGHSHGHAHGHRHGTSHSGSDGVESGFMALAIGMVPCPGAVVIMLYAVANDMIYPGFILVAAMSVGIGLSICIIGVAAILLREHALRVLERSGGGHDASRLRTAMNYAGATLVTLVGLLSFLAFLDAPLT